MAADVAPPQNSNALSPPVAGHRAMNTMEQIDAAMNASLESVLGDVGRDLNDRQKKKLMTFMEFTEAEVKPSIKYLKATGWQPQEAADLYWKDHPEKVVLSLSFCTPTPHILCFVVVSAHCILHTLSFSLCPYIPL